MARGTEMRKVVAGVLEREGRSMIGYKLTNDYNQTYGGCRWNEGVTHETLGAGDLCGPGWIHFSSDPVLAVLFNPIHMGYSPAYLWEVSAVEPVKRDLGIKYGSTKVTAIQRLELPVVTPEQRIAFAIFCTRKVYHDPAWDAWATNWLNGQDRTAETALSAAKATGYPRLQANLEGSAIFVDEFGLILTDENAGMLTAYAAMITTLSEAHSANWAALASERAIRVASRLGQPLGEKEIIVLARLAVPVKTD